MAGLFESISHLKDHSAEYCRDDNGLQNANTIGVGIDFKRTSHRTPFLH